MSLIMIFYQKHKYQIQIQKANVKINNLFFFISILILPICFMVTNTVFKSLKGQMFLLQDF